ncbi:MAG: hypothetical protein F4114_18635 [Rhodospirillaceae bacterium]|nr:hypothetical protein [Rhodospirillaceae bacterium]MYB12436.1 hypothetical protein [Rhodospirillaceae bacterium]MYI51088.1 hypothetical protein [Rhodospirillaceae bacterium]
MRELAYREYLTRYRKVDGAPLKDSSINTYCQDIRYVERNLGVEIESFLRSDLERALPRSIPSGYGTAVNHYRAFLRER